MTVEKLKQYCVGLDVYKARNRIMHLCPDIEEKDIDITFRESRYQRFTVIDCDYSELTGKVMLYATSGNAIRHLPANYQSNDFLRNFLMIFQHLMNDISVTVDNLHELFRPMECHPSFLPVLADWFGVHLETLGDENAVRRFLQYAIPLYRCRGTVLGLKAHLFIVSGIVPEIIEGSLPYSMMEISELTDVASQLFEKENSAGFFTVYFPVKRHEVEDGLVRRLSVIIQQEKPVHTKCYLCFKKDEKKKRKVTVLTNETYIGSDAGFTI